MTVESYAPPNIQSVIDRQPLLMTEEQTVTAAIAAMAEKGSSCVLVVKQIHQSIESSALVGILTARDLIRISILSTPIDQLTLQAVMSQPVITLSASTLTDLETALKLFQSHGVPYLPVIDQQNFLVGLLAQDSLIQCWAQTIFQSERSPNPPSLSASEQHYRSLAKTVPVGIFRTDATGKGTYHNEQWYKIAGISPEASADQGWKQALHPEDRDRVAAAWQKFMQEDSSFQMEYRFQQPDGKVVWVYGQVAAERDADGQITGYAGTLTDISDRKRAEAQLEFHNTLLAKIAKNEPLINILHGVVDAVEQSLHGAVCSILLLDQENRLRAGAAPNLPADYNQIIDGIPIGEGVGSCGTAAFRNETVVVSNIATDPLWQNYKEFPLRYGLQACWSSPVTSSVNQVLGTFAVYYREVRSPHPSELEVIARMANIVGIAIEREQANIALKDSQARWQFALEGAGDGLWDWNVLTNQVFFSEQWKAMLGYTDPEIQNHAQEWERRIHPEDKSQCFEALQRVFRRELPFYQIEHRVRCKNNSYKWILARGKVIEWTEDGQPLRMIGTHTDINDRKQDEQQLENLIAGTAATTGEDFFPALANHIAKALNVSYALVTEKIGPELNILAFSAHGSLQKTFTYPLAETPCGQALQQGQYYCESSVQQKFPNDLDLVDMQAESYLGIALHDSQGQVIGNLCILDQQPIQDPQKAQTILQVFAARAAAELERERSAQALAKLNRELETRIWERTAALKKSQHRYHILLDGASDAIFLANEHGNLIEVNQKAVELLGYSRDELIHLHISHIHPPTVLEAARNHFQTIMMGHPAPILESLVLRKDGREVPVDITASLIEIEGEQIAQGIFRNTTDRKQAELALEREACRRAAIFNASSDGIHILDRNGNLIESNDSFAYMLGYTPSEIVGFNVVNWDAQWPKEKLQEVLKDTSLDGITFETIHRRKDGSIFPVEISRQAMEWQGDSVLVNISRDISDRKEYEQRLEKSNVELLQATQLKDEFLAAMSHELRTPLNAILGMSEMLQEEVLGEVNERQKKAITTIESSGEHLLSLINDILEVSKIEAGKLELKLSTVAISELCNASLTFVKQQAAKKQLQLVTYLASNLGNIQVDDRRMQQVLINLLSNAVKFTPDQGSVTLEVRKIEEKCHFSVIDTGIGIALADQSKLFQPFVQIDGKLNRKYEGTGLGLMLVKQIVELHGGSVSFTSELNRGSCFTVSIPCPHAINPPTLTEITPTLTFMDILEESMIKQPLILLAEDNQYNVDTICSYLEACDYQMILAGNGQEAINLTQTHQPDLILMDIQMPEMDGLEAMRRIRQDLQLADLPIIALTALAMEGDQEKCLAAGANNYLTKPVKLKQLKATIQQMIANRSLN